MKITVHEAKQEDVLAKLKGLDSVKDAGKVLADLKDMGFTGIDSGTYVFSGNSYIVMEHPDGMYVELDYTTEPGGDVPAEVKSYDYFKDIEDYKLHHGGNAPRESRKKSEARYYTLWASFGKNNNAYYAADANGDSWNDDPDEAYEFSSRSDANKAIKSFVDTLNSGVGGHFNWTADKVFITPQFRKTESKKSEDASDELKGIDVKKGSILEDVVDWAEYEVGEGYTVKELLEELMNKGVYSGMTFLIDYEDGKNFFEEHKQEINEILAEAMSDLGQFPELQDFDKEDPLCLGVQNQFCLSAFAFEKVASDLLDTILDKE